MNFVFVMDPLETINYEKDTSFALMSAAHERGHNIYYCPNAGITSNENIIAFDATQVKPNKNPDQLFTILKKESLSQDNVQAVFIRTDPPFNELYLMNTWLLDRLPKNIFVMNNPTGMRTVNEKVWATQFTTIIPPTIVSANKEQLLDFLKKHSGAVAKPTDGFGGQSVFKLTYGHSNAVVAMETLSHQWRKPIIVQKYIPEAEAGDKRILLLNGEPIGAVLRVHGDGDHRNNFFAGGKAVKTEITNRDRDIIATLKPHLLKLGLTFVGIDIMGEYLIEVNVTSPTCLREINTLYGKELHQDVIAFVEKEIASRS